MFVFLGTAVLAAADKGGGGGGGRTKVLEAEGVTLDILDDILAGSMAAAAAAALCFGVRKALLLALVVPPLVRLALTPTFGAGTEEGR